MRGMDGEGATEPQIRARHRRELREQAEADLALCPIAVANRLGLKPKDVAAAMRHEGAGRPIKLRQADDWMRGLDRPPFWLTPLLDKAEARIAERKVQAARVRRREEREAAARGRG